MTRLEQHGRFFLMILATLIVLDQSIRFFLILLGVIEGYNFLHDEIMPLSVVVCMLRMWNGDHFQRKLIALWACSYYGFQLLMFMNNQLETIPSLEDEASHSTGVFLSRISFYLFAGTSLFFSKSIFAFLNYQSGAAKHSSRE